MSAKKAKPQVFVWLAHPTLPNHKLTVFAFDSDSAMGVLQSRIHQVWSPRLGTRLETHTPSTCFETFPFPFAQDTAAEDPLQVVAGFSAAHHHFDRDNILIEEQPPSSPQEGWLPVEAACLRFSL